MSSHPGSLRAAIACSLAAAVLVPAGSLLKDGGLLHGLSILLSLGVAAILTRELRQPPRR